jgi:hypothetical protein
MDNEVEKWVSEFENCLFRLEKRDQCQSRYEEIVLYKTPRVRRLGQWVDDVRGDEELKDLLGWVFHIDEIANKLQELKGRLPYRVLVGHEYGGSTVEKRY